MTKEERHIAVLSRLLESMDVYDSIKPTTERKKAIKAAIKALSQEPCDDAISRDAVIKAVDAHTNEDGTLDDDISVILENLPSVTQKPKYWIDKDSKLYKLPDDIPQKSGKWIKKEDDTCWWYVCSECEQEPLKNRWNDDDVLSTFCPNCGARMESEE